MSFVMTGRDEGVASALEYARSKGVLIVAAAGNSGSADVTFPAGEPGVVSVTGTDAADGRYAWANYGSWVTLAAPGCSPSTRRRAAATATSAARRRRRHSSRDSPDSRARSAQRSVLRARSARRLPRARCRVGGFVAAGRVDADALLTSLRSAEAPPASAPAPADRVANDPRSSVWSE